MKNILVAVFVLMFAFSNPAYSADQWAKGKPAGTDSPSDIDTLIATNNEALDRLLIERRLSCTVIYDTAEQIKVLSGELAIQNSAGTVVRWRRNTSTTTVTWADIDTGSEATSTQYYVYALADTDATTFTVKISTSSSAPSGGTYYRKIGYFYNDSSGDIISVGNIAGGDVANSLSAIGTDDISTTSTTYADIDDMIIYFVGSGRPVSVLFNAPIKHAGANSFFSIDVDGTDKVEGAWDEDASGPQMDLIPMMWEGVLSSGTHTIKIQWKVDGTALYQLGSTKGDRVMIVTEK